MYNYKHSPVFLSDSTSHVEVDQLYCLDSTFNGLLFPLCIQFF